MCVSLPGRVVALGDHDGVPTAQVDFGGTVRAVNLTFLPEADVGDYILTHSGFGVRRAEPSHVSPSTADAGSSERRRSLASDSRRQPPSWLDGRDCP